MNIIDSTDSQYKHITDECYYKAKTVPELKKLCSILNIDVKMYKNKKKADIIKIIMDNLISTQSQQIDKKTPTPIIINSNNYLDKYPYFHLQYQHIILNLYLSFYLVF